MFELHRVIPVPSMPSPTFALRPPAFHRFLAFVLLSVPVWIPQSAHAKGMQPLSTTGVVQAIDLTTKSITLQRATSGTPLKLVWYWDTQFFNSGRRMHPDALKVGTQVKVRYHSPLFGREFLTEIEWDSGPVHLSH